MAQARHRRKSMWNKIWGSVAAVVVALPLVAVPVSTAAAEEQGFLTVKKSASVTEVVPGQTFTYTVEIGCTTFGAGCTNAALSDLVPDGLIVVGTPTLGGTTTGDVTVTGNQVDVVFTNSLADPVGSIGMPAASTAIVTITVQVDPDLPYSASGVPIVNTATADGTNTDPSSATAPVTPTVPLDLGTTATKTVEPASAPAVPGTALTATIGATNTSNAPVDSLTLTDPADPTATPSPFEHLAFTGFGTVTFPPAADQVQVEVWDGSAWVAGPVGATPELPAGVAPEDVQGVRLTFTSSTGAKIDVGASAQVPLELEQRAGVADLDDPLTVTNTTSSGVVLGDEDATSDPASDTYEIVPANLSATAGKTFSPDQVTAGDPSTVTLTGSNTGTPVESLTIAEPGPGAASNPFENGLTFTGFGTDGQGAGVVWPADATAATVTFTYDDGTTETLTASGPGTLPQPPPGKVVTGFVVEFTGDIVVGAQATVPFTVDTDPDQDVEELAHDNEILVTVADGGSTGTATAEDTLTTYVDRLAVDVSKQISPAQILARPGEVATVQLPTHIKPFPDSTTDATHLVVQDPSVVPPNPSPDPWWNAFDAKSISQTAIPAGATLTIRYWDGTDWVVLPGGENLVGPQIVNIPIPDDLKDDIQGLQFDYENPEGFPPGTSVQPNFTAELRDPQRDGTALENVSQTIENCASAQASVGDVSGAAVVPSPCPTIELVPVTPGTGDLVEKEFLESVEGGGKTVIARSGDQIDARLHWSTGGYSGLDQVVVSDVADPETTAVAASVFDAFDLVAVKPITPTTDPLMAYDAVERVELWNGTAWVAATDDPCTASATACDGTFPGVTLTADEQASTTSVRLVVIESPTRAEKVAGDPALPQPGEGVSRSFGNDRTIDLTFEVRDTKRSDGSPALGSTAGTIYNQAAAGQVLNTARVSGFTDGSQVVTDTGSDVVTIIDVPLNVDVTKSWSGGPLGVPVAGTATESYPSGRVRIEATNATAAKVDELRIVEPASDAPADNPFRVFDVKDVVTISVPSGATSTSVTLIREGGTSTTHTREEVLGFGADELADVVGMFVTHTGRIDAGATTVLVLDTRLRAEIRGTSDPVTVADSPVQNRTEASVSDLGGNVAGADPTADDSASITLVPQGISLETTKTFTPDVVVEPGTGPVTLTLTGTPGGASRADRMVLTDVDPQFWNQYDFEGFGSAFGLTAPIDRVQVDAFVGGTFGTDAAGVTVTGGSWVEGEPTTAADVTLPDGVSPAQVQGLRFTFTRADGAIWENPATPTQSVPLQVERRTELRTGGPVLSDMAGNAPAPGETAAGVASNSVQGVVEGADRVGDLPITATDDADASILYQHLSNAVQVVKKANGAEAGGSQAPGASFPYTLEVTNTGQVPIVDPVVTDHLPSDAGGPQLVFDPDAYPGGAGAYAYTLTGDAPDPANGPAVPTDPSEVAVAVQGDVEQLRFTFPAGTVLEVGQTYTITVQLMLRPGLAGGTAVVNTVGVTGERPWDQCVSTLDPTTGECQASTTVTVAKAGTLRSEKLVRAEDTELGTFSSTGEGECVADDDGFYAFPCVPITKPASDEVWRLHYKNTGNLPMNQLLVVDKLPTPGDTGAGNPLPRGSQWRPLLEGRSELVGAPAGSYMVRFYTFDPEPCVVQAECVPGDWIDMTGTEGPDVLDRVTGIMTAVVFPEDNLFQPLDEVAIDFWTTTPATSPTEGPDTIAWNSIGGTAQTIDGDTQTWIAATEGNKVGVALATGPVSVVKDVTGEGKHFAPESFSVRLVCTSGAGTRLETEVPLGDRGDLTLVEGVPQTVEDIPWGSECTVEEDEGAALPTDFDATTVTVVRDDQTLPVVIATNRYDLAGLVIAKTVDSAAVDQDGEPVAYGPFTVEVRCTFLGEDVYAEGYGPDAPMVLEVPAGGQVELTGLPPRAECTVTETGTAGAPSTTISVTQGEGEPATTDGTTTDVTLLPDSDGTTANAVLVTNTFDVGEVELTKVVDGEGASFGTGPFTLSLVCTLDDASGSRVVYDGKVVVGGDQPLEATVENLASGAVCVVTETDDGGATSVDVSPGEVTVGSGVPVTVTVTNTFDLGSLVVTKEVTGEGAELYGSGPFEVTLRCTLDGAEIEIPGGASRAVSPDGPATYDGLPVGAECAVTETLTGGATSTVVSGDGEPVVVEAGESAEVTVTNTFDVGEVRVVKRLSGSGAPQHQGDEFEFLLVCTQDVDGETVPVVVPGGPTRTASAATDWVAVFTDLPVGAACTLTETTYGGADEVQVIVDGEGTVTDPEAAAPTSVEFRLPPGDDVCLPVEVVNTWGTARSASGAAPVTEVATVSARFAGATALAAPVMASAASVGTPAAQLRTDAGCDPEPPGGLIPPGGGLASTGADGVPVALLASLLIAAGYVLVRSTRGRRV
ncbi:DUF5979 domain-containing protein [Oerskovia sp. NPDC060287]|uniref:DUF5979 domain-containing protein n=1 Tax=Oerskovia sp. NPDC060287 TaxID=3347095 RepID=UPI003667432C